MSFCFQEQNFGCTQNSNKKTTRGQVKISLLVMTSIAQRDMRQKKKKKKDVHVSFLLLRRHRFFLKPGQVSPFRSSFSPQLVWSIQSRPADVLLKWISAESTCSISSHISLTQKRLPDIPYGCFKLFSRPCFVQKFWIFFHSLLAFFSTLSVVESSRFCGCLPGPGPPPPLPLLGRCPCLWAYSCSVGR